MDAEIETHFATRSVTSFTHHDEEVNLMAFDDKTVPVKHRITLTRAALARAMMRQEIGCLPYPPETFEAALAEYRRGLTA